MFNLSILATIITLTSFLSFVSAQIPYFPNITDPNFPLGSRCVDYCAFLAPRELCPGRALDVNCLCEVYNARLLPCEQCWADKNATVANDLLAVLNFCKSYANGTLTSPSASASMTATTVGTTTSASASSHSSTTASLAASDASFNGNIGGKSYFLAAGMVGLVLSFL